MGDKHEALAPGHRLPDTIKVNLSGGEGRLLHELAHRVGHTGLVIGGLSVGEGDVLRLEEAVRSQCGGNGIGARFVERTLALAVDPEDRNRCGRLEPSAGNRLGISEFTLLVVRPDGHVGLRADRNYLNALAAYSSLLASGHPGRL